MIIYLYVKQHASTGLKYFGKTTRHNPYSYKGSGTYWRHHLKQHGRHVNTLEVWGFDDMDQCTAFALEYSRVNNIVASDDWANLVEETGLDGTVKGSRHSEEHKAQISCSLLGHRRSVETKARMSVANLGKILSEEHRAKLATAKRGNKNASGPRSAATRAKMSASAKARRLPVI